VYLLVVDDDPAFSRVVCHALKRDGYQVVAASSGPEALALIRQSAPKLVLIDLMMSGINGLQVLLVLKSDCATRDIPVIVWTATVSDDITRQALAFEANAMLYKTRFSMVELRKLVRRLAPGAAPAHDDPPMQRILVVDDDDNTREAVEKYLTDGGYAVATAANGWEALLMLDRELVNLVVLDLVMPGMDGPTFLRILRNGKHADIPVIAITAYDVQEMTRVIQPLGVDGILAKKPPLWDTLLPAVQDALRAA
jgi:CheY-like chemotaxis protein